MLKTTSTGGAHLSSNEERERDQITCIGSDHGVHGSVG